MLESLGIDKALQSIQDEPASNTSKLTKTDKCITEDSKKLKEVEYGPTYSEEQRQQSRNRLNDLNTELKYYHETKTSLKTDCKDQTDH